MRIAAGRTISKIIEAPNNIAADVPDFMAPSAKSEVEIHKQLPGVPVDIVQDI